MSDTTVKRSIFQALGSSVRKHGASIVNNLSMAVKTTRLYSFSHQNVVNALRELLEILEGFIRLEGEAELTRIEEHLFINDIRIRVDLGGMRTYAFVVGLLKERDIGAVAFSDGLQEAEITRLVDLLAEKPPGGDRPWTTFEARLRSCEFPHIRIEKYEVRQKEDDSVSTDERMNSIRLYFRALQQTGAAFDSAAEGRKMNFKRLKRTLQMMVDTILDETPYLLALVNARDTGPRMVKHAVNVLILALYLGAKLGFPRKLLADLGTAALLHDLGKLRVPGEIRDRSPDELDPQSRERLEAHVYEGVKILLDQRITDAVLKSMNVAFQHHCRFDSTGYPKTYAIREQNFYSRIIAVCNHYESGTSPRSGGARDPDALVRELLDGSGTEFDPLVVKAFVNLMGLYPVGSLVTLDTGELGVVEASSPDPRYLDRPRVRLIADASGNPVEEVVDLLEREGRKFVRSILKLYQHEEVELDMEEYISIL